MVSEIKEPRLVKARKNHICQGCKKTIVKGEQYFKSDYADGGTAWTFHECGACIDYRKNKCVKCKDYDMCIGEDYYYGVIKECIEESNK